MKQCCWKARNGEFYIGLNIGGIALDMLLDTGFSHPRCEVGIGLEALIYDRLKRNGKIDNEKTYQRILANGSTDIVVTGEVEAQLICAGHIFGPKVKVRARKGTYNSVGYCFFKTLKGCRLIWEFEEDEICIEWKGVV